MSRNNTFYSKYISKFESIDDFNESLDFLEEAFDEFEEVSFLRDNENQTLYIYFDTDKKMYMKVIPNTNKGTIVGIKMLFYFNDVEDTRNAVTSGTTYIHYVRTKYGIVWSLTSNSGSTETSWSPPFIYTPDPVPTLWIGLNVANSNTYAIISPLHETIETISENSLYLSPSLGNQKFIMTTAYSCLEDINAQHVFRVLGCHNSLNAPMGRIKVGDKYVFWVGRYALEYDPDDTTGV